MARKQSIHRKNKQYEAAKKKLGKPFFESKGIAIYQGDTLELSSKLPANVIDALITDPPYCSGASGSAVMADPSKKYCQSGKTLGRPSFGGDFRDQRSFKYWCSLWISQAVSATKGLSVGTKEVESGQRFQKYLKTLVGVLHTYE